TPTVRISITAPPQASSHFAPRRSRRASPDRSAHALSVAVVPFIDGELRVLRIARPAPRHLHPPRLVAEHEVDVLGSDGERGVERPRVRPHALRPALVEHVEMRAAFAAEPALALAAHGPLPRVADHRMVDAQMLRACHPQGVALTHDVAAKRPARRLAADRAVAIHEGDRRFRLQTEADLAALARAFESHAEPS